MRSLKSVVFAVAALFYFTLLYSANALVGGVNAVYLDGNGMTTPTVFGVSGNTDTFFMSFWYNIDQPPHQGAPILMVPDHNGRTTLQVSLVGDLKSPYLEVDAIDENGDCAHLDTQGTFGQPVLTVPFDGKWHNIVIQLWVRGGLLEGDLALDGNIQTLDGSGKFVFDEFPWSESAAWNVGGPGYIGNLAELYVDVEGSLVTEDLTPIIVAEFFDSSTDSAPGLSPPGSSCTTPSGLIPSTCNRGEPCNFVLGPETSTMPLTYVYILMPARPLQSAITDPCKFINDGLGPDGYVPGSGCPATAHHP